MVRPVIAADDRRHGERAGYLAGCKCLPCRRANSRYLKAYRVSRAQTGPRRIPAAPVHAHIGHLRRTMSLGTIAVAAGLSRDTVRHALTHDTITPRVATAILNIRTTTPTARHQVAAHGTVRRLRALACLGYSVSDIAEASGRSKKALEELRRGGEGAQYVHGDTALAVARVYDALWMTPKSGRGLNAQTRGHIGQTIRSAARQGWVPPLAWDDATIDDPDAVPEGAGYKPGPRIEQVRELEALGLTRAGIAARLGVTQNAIDRTIDRDNAKTGSTAA